MDKERIVLAMSGGVDSCASAILLYEMGYDVIGVSMQVWDYRNHGGNAKRATCCAPSDFDDARKISEKYGFPFYVFDFEESFKSSVIDPFIKTYLKGETPNPCLDCNRKVKFRELRSRAKTLGAKKVATGHYARVRKKADDSYGLYTSRDLEKDQSYFLYALTQEELKDTYFPVGDMVKKDVRKVLSDNAFEVSSKPESQDICFVSSNVSNFIKSRGYSDKPGLFKTVSGETLGEHDGIYNFTVGQRRGLGLSHHSPLYVIQINSNDNSVVVGEKADLEKKSFFVRDVTWIREKGLKLPFISLVKLRYRHDGARCLIEDTEQKDQVKLTFIDEWSSVSPGQAAVFYEDSENVDMINIGREVYGGGIISKDE